MKRILLYDLLFKMKMCWNANIQTAIEYTKNYFESLVI